MTAEPFCPMSVADLLRHHLLTEPRCRRRWRARASRSRPGEVNQSAVAQVLAEWLWESGEADASDVLLPRRLKDRVSRALSPSEGPSVSTLSMLVEAFDISPEVADELWEALLNGAARLGPSG